MTAEECFIAAILANPDADGPRLQFADWLEERGDERAPKLREPGRLMLCRIPAGNRLAFDLEWRIHGYRNTVVAGRIDFTEETQLRCPYNCANEQGEWHGLYVREEGKWTGLSCANAQAI